MQPQIEEQFQNVLKRLAPQFGDDIDLQAVLFLIGLQELGKGPVKLKKHEKLDVMHVAICTLLEPFGHYVFEGHDPEGWPHWKVNEKLPALKPGQQQALIKEAIVDYFTSNELI